MNFHLNRAIERKLSWAEKIVMWAISTESDENWTNGISRARRIIHNYSNNQGETVYELKFKQTWFRSDIRLESLDFSLGVIDSRDDLFVRFNCTVHPTTLINKACK